MKQAVFEEMNDNSVSLVATCGIPRKNGEVLSLAVLLVSSALSGSGVSLSKSAYMLLRY